MSLGNISNAFPQGRPSGLPDDIVDQLVQAKQKQKLEPLQEDIEEKKELKDTYSSLNSKLVDLFKASDSLDDKQSFTPSSASSSKESVASVEADSNALPGTYSLDVSQRAQAHTQIVGVDDGHAGTGVAQGISDAQDSSLINSGTNLSFYHEGTEYSYTTDDSTTLASLANTISNDDNNVTAQALNIGTSEDPQYILSMKSETTGDGTKQITTDEAGENPGISIDAELFADENGDPLTNEQETTQTGQNAEFSVDGTNFSRSSNEVSDVIDNATINLHDTGTSEITVSRDVEKVTQNVQDFVDAFNKHDAFLKENASYNKDEDKGGPLLGDSLARSTKNSLSSILSQPVSGGSYEYLFQVGIEKNSDGTLAFDQAKFQEAFQEDPEGVQNLFVGQDSAADRVSSYLKNYTDNYGGVIPSKIDNFDSQISSLEDDYAAAQEDLEDYRAQQTRKFGKLEDMVMRYQSTEEQLSSYINTWDNNG
ncbi:MAG: flagellar filament capping protein FliD [Desulfohalobiaceae bacterium]